MTRTCCCISVAHCYSWYLPSCVNCKPQFKPPAGHIQPCAHCHRQWIQNECDLRPRKRSIKSNFKARSQLFIDTSCSSSSVQQGKQSYSLIQSRLKAQGNLRLVTTNVRLNSSSHYLWGERERAWPKTIQKRAARRVKTCTQKTYKKKNTRQWECRHISTTSTRFCI